jgi:hypothetical protein
VIVPVAGTVAFHFFGKLSQTRQREAVRYTKGNTFWRIQGLKKRG